MDTTATTLSWQPSVPTRPSLHRHRTFSRPISVRRAPPILAFQRSDFDSFAKRVTSGETWRGVWRTANDGFEQFVFEAKKTAERIDRRYSVSRRVSSAATTAMERAREIDREFEIGARWRTFTMDFSRNFPRYRKQFSDLLDTPLGRSATAVFFLWFAFSGWLFRILILATWVLPIAGPLLIGTLANNLVIKGACPACKRQFVGNKRQTIRCAGCGNVVWQPKGGDFFSRGGGGGGGGGGGTKASRNSDPNIIDVEFEEK